MFDSKQSLIDSKQSIVWTVKPLFSISHIPIQIFQHAKTPIKPLHPLVIKHNNGKSHVKACQVFGHNEGCPSIIPLASGKRLQFAT